MFKKFAIINTKKYWDGIYLEFDVPGGNKDNIFFSVVETEINSGKYILIINHYCSDARFKYELTELQDEQKIKANIKDGILVVTIPDRQKKGYEVVVD